MNNDNIYYSVFYNKYDNISNSDDFFTSLRKHYFYDYAKQKNKIVNKIGNDTYHYSYCLEQGKPMKWKKLKNSKLVEKSVNDKEGTYHIFTYGDNRRLKKATYFDKEHMWIKTEYFNSTGRLNPILTILPGEDMTKILTTEYNEELNKKVSNNMFCCNLDADQNEINAINASLKDPYIIAYSKNGPTLFCSEEGIEKRKAMLIDLQKTNDILFGSSKTDDLSAKDIFDDEYISSGSTQDDITPCKQDITETTNDQQCNTLNNKVEPSYYELNDPYYDEQLDLSVEKIIESLNSMQDDDQEELINNAEPIIDSLDNKTYQEIIEENSECEEPTDEDDIEKPLYEDDDKILYNYFKDDPNENVCLISRDNQSENIDRAAYKYQKLDTPEEGDDMNINDIEIQQVVTDPIIYINEQAKANKLGIYFDEDKNLFYLGKWENPDVEEKGFCFDINGNLVYIGHFKNHLKSGFGAEYSPDGKVVYNGSWSEDLYNGDGTLYYSNGHTINGKFESGQVCGFAIEYDCNGAKVYEGQWKNSLYNGEGCKHFRNGNYCKGTFVDGNISNKMEAYDKYGNIVYNGECSGYEYNGKGTYYVNNQIIYEGNFSNNCYNGFGKKYENGHCIYEGNFKMNLKHGFGKSYKNGDLNYIGFFENDMYNGYGVLYEGDSIFIGEFSENQKHGRINIVKDNHIEFECIYNNNIPVYVNEFKNDILVFKGNIRDNKRNGMGCTFSPYCEKEEEGIFTDGEISNTMKVSLKSLEKLPEVEELKDTDYEKYRLAPEYVIEKNIGNCIYSGSLENSMPNGKGTMLYSDHRYIGEFKDGNTCGYGIIYNNAGNKIEGYFYSIENRPKNYSEISFDDITYYFEKAKHLN